MTTSQLIDTPAELRKLVRHMHGQAFVAVDTEFVRERTYYARLCLIQFATPSTIACVDAIALDDLSPLQSILFDTTITKVLHAARQDYEIFVQLTGLAPAPLFDTQIAADLCGLGDQGGFAALASRLLSVDLDKSHTRTDWSRRPLSDEQMQYAIDDVRYLVPIYQELLECLRERERTTWHTEECEKLTDPGMYRVEPGTAWKRLGGLAGLSAPQYHAARLLAEWREKRAMASDRPRGWILRDDVLLRTAAALPASADELMKIEGFPRPLIKKSSALLLDIVAAARTCDEPMPALPAPLTAEQRKLGSRLMDTVRKIAGEVGVSASMLATRRDVNELVRQNPDAAPLQGWRRPVIGDRLLAISEPNA